MFLRVFLIKCLFVVNYRAICHLRDLARRGPELRAIADLLLALPLAAAVGRALREEVLVVLVCAFARLFAATGYLLANCLVSLRGNAVVFLIGGGLVGRLRKLAELSIVAKLAVRSVCLLIVLRTQSWAAHFPCLMNGEFGCIGCMICCFSLIADFLVIKDVVSTVPFW